MINVKLINLPTTIRGFSKKTGDDYTIVLNAKMSQDIMRRTYRHELEHIKRGDLDGSGDIDIIERILHDVDRTNPDG